MKREVKILLSASLLALLCVAAPVLVANARHRKEVELLSRTPRAATVRFRQSVRGFTHINVFPMTEADTPGNQIPPTDKPIFVLTGEDATRVVRAIHFEWPNGSAWSSYNGPYAGSIFGCTALQFCSDKATLADLRVGMERGGGLGARWYAPPAYIGDSSLLPASRDFLERRFNRSLSSSSF